MDDNGTSLQEVPTMPGGSPDIHEEVRCLRRDVQNLLENGVAATVEYHRWPVVAQHMEDGTEQQLALHDWVQAQRIRDVTAINQGFNNADLRLREVEDDITRLAELPDTLAKLLSDVGELAGRVDELGKRLDRMSAAAHAVIQHGDSQSQVRIERTDGADGGGRPGFIEKG